MSTQQSTPVSARENTAIVQQAYAAFASGDIKTLVGLTSKDVDWEAVVGAGPAVPTRGARRGQDAVTTFFGQLAESVDFKRFEPREFIADKDKVVTLGYYEGVSKKTGRTFASDWVMVFTLDGGKVVKFREYADMSSINAAF